MRWRKRNVKRFDAIIKKFYSSKADPMFRSVSSSLNARGYPLCRIAYRNRTTKNHYSVCDYDNLELFLRSFISVPIYKNSRVKRSKVQGLCTSYRMMKIDEINEVLGTNLTMKCLENYQEFIDTIEEIKDV